MPQPPCTKMILMSSRNFLRSLLWMRGMWRNTLSIYLDKKAWKTVNKSSDRMTVKNDVQEMFLNQWPFLNKTNTWIMTVFVREEKEFSRWEKLLTFQWGMLKKHPRNLYFTWCRAPVTTSVDDKSKSDNDNDLTLYESDSESDSGSSDGQANAVNYTVELTTAQTSKKGRKTGHWATRCADFSCDLLG